MPSKQLPKVRVLTDATRRIDIHSDGAAFFDLLLTMWTLLEPDEDHDGFEQGQEWFEQMRTASAPFFDDMEKLGGPHGANWLGVLGAVAAADGPRAFADAVADFASVDPVELRMILLENLGIVPGKWDVDDVVAASKGDSAANDRVVAAWVEHEGKAYVPEYLRVLLATSPSDWRDEATLVMKKFWDAAFRPFESSFADASRRAADARRALVNGVDPERVIESVTNGLDYRIGPGINRLVLIASVVIRPWAVIDRQGDTLVVVYPVPDEFVDADPDAPPSWLVKLHKALGDERRMRMLRRIADGGAGLDDLVEFTGLTKSTVHHHARLLRAAGLIRIHIDASARTQGYTLRSSVLPEALSSLERYLGHESATDHIERSEA